VRRDQRKRKPGDCEICGFRGCPVCSEDELFRQMGVTSFQTLEDKDLFAALQDQITAMQAEFHNFKIMPASSAQAFSQHMNKIAYVFEEICERKIKSF